MLNARRLVAAIIMSLSAVAWLAVPDVPAMAAGTSANFWIHCEYTGVSRTIDPIVAPGSTTTAHFHDFFGNTSISENSTPSSLIAANVPLGAATTCTTSTDGAAYWAPSLVIFPYGHKNENPASGACAADTNLSYAGYSVCHYTNIRAYDANSGASGSTANYRTTPAGEEALGGDSNAPGVQGITAISWSCGDSSPFEKWPYDCAGVGGDTKYTCSAATSPDGNGNCHGTSTDQDGVIMRVNIQRCWNQANPSDYHNFAPPTGTGISSTTCPSTINGITGQSVLLPLINIRFHTGIYDPCRDANGVALSCPAGSSAFASNPTFGFENSDQSVKPWYQGHGDFMNGWAVHDDPGGLADLETDCLIGTTVTCPANPHTGPNSYNMPT